MLQLSWQTMKSNPRPNAGVSPLTKYFAIVPRQAHKQEVSTVKQHESAGTIKRTRGSKCSTISPPSSPIEIFSDDDTAVDLHNGSPPPRKKTCHHFTIKQLFDDSIPNKPEFPPVDSSWCPRYLRSPSSPTSSTSSESGDNDLPSVFTKDKETNRKVIKAGSLSPPSLRVCVAAVEPSKPNTEEVCVLRKMVCDDNNSYYDNTNEPSEDYAIEEASRDPPTDPMEDIMEKLVGIETKKVTLDTMINFRGVPKAICHNDAVRTSTDAQEERVNHYLTMCMASPSLQLYSTVSYLRMITSSTTIPSGYILLTVWNFLLQNEVDLSVAEDASRYFSSLLCLQPPLDSTHLTNAQYSQFVIHIGSDIIHLLLNSTDEWKVVLLEFLSGLLLQDYKHSSMQDSQSTPNKCQPLLYQQVFWPKSNLHHVNQPVRTFIRKSIELLEADVTSLMELSIHYQRIFPSLFPPKRDLFLCILRPLSLSLAIYKDSTTNQ